MPADSAEEYRSHRSDMEAVGSYNRCCPPKYRFVLLVVITFLELAMGFVLRLLNALLWFRIYVLSTRSLALGLMIVTLCVWRHQPRLDAISKLLVFTYSVMTTVDLVLMIILCVYVYDVQLYKNPNCQATRDPCEVSLRFELVIGCGTAFFFLKLIGLLFSCYRIRLMQRDKIMARKELRRLSNESQKKKKKVDFAPLPSSHDEQYVTNSENSVTQEKKGKLYIGETFEG